MSDQDRLPEEQEFQQNLGWLVDVPLFIDKERVSQLYDVTIQPIFREYSRDKVEETERELESSSKRGAAGGDAKVESSGMLSMIAGGSVKGWIEGEYTRTDEDEDTARYELTQTPQRQLAQIAIEYFLADQNRQSDRRNYYYVDPSDESTPDAGWTKGSSPSEPRDFVILELPGRENLKDDDDRVPAKLVPTAAEFQDGTVVELYQHFEERYEKPPRYPDPEKKWGEMGRYYDYIEQTNPDHSLANVDRDDDEEIGDNVEEAREYYWRWFDEKFNGKKATKIVEDVCKEYGDLRWIDFRLPLNEKGSTLHLHIQPRENYNTGTFAYNLIKRGYKHGLLIVGTVKSEPDMDVLAIYER